MSLRRQRPEQAIQRAVFAHIRARGAPGLVAFHVPMGGARTATEGAILKSLGATAGVPDVIAVHQGRCYAMELKAPGGRVSESQRAMIAALERAGAFTCIAEGLDRALSALEQWGLLKGRAT